MLKTTTFLTIFGVAGLGLAACDAPERDPRVKVDEPVVEEPAGPSMSEVVGTKEELSQFVAAIGPDTANMGPYLDGAKNMTLLAPSNDAFDSMEPTAKAFLFDEANRPSLRAALGYHMLRGDLDAAAIMERIAADEDGEITLPNNARTPMTAKMVDDALVIVDARGNEAKVLSADIPTANGTVHIIDTVLMLPEG
ncbi:fasciclin domain-containing protein [Pacificimonas sp. WHA3]|uniref:Fasciclin domain-containing protein n=1 Tax=Pacificimonas pallii TaxID=2827236 RepID=A0ABS6SE25_9SPHN|nr:fasciclin domain-containing protein [Pacificimonas pallii]MBV7256649.1 fasciclin domain-containing protein [Pacificimonas pallii]